MWVETDYDYIEKQRMAKEKPTWLNPYYYEKQSCQCDLCGAVEKLQKWNLLSDNPNSKGWFNRWFLESTNRHWCRACLTKFQEAKCTHKPKCKMFSIHGYGSGIKMCQVPDRLLEAKSMVWDATNTSINKQIAKLQAKVDKNLDKVAAYKIELEKRQASIASEDESGND